MPFMHRKLDVFQMAARWTVEVEAATRDLPRSWWWLRDQVLRAAGSIPLNIAEGSAQSGTPQERRYYRIARDSAAECDACIYILHLAGLLDPKFVDESEDTLNRVSAMLRSLINRSETRQAAR